MKDSARTIAGGGEGAGIALMLTVRGEAVTAKW